MPAGPSPGVRPPHVQPRRPPPSKVGAGRCECGRVAPGLLGLAAGARRYPLPHCGLARKILSKAVTMSVLIEDLTVCVGDGCTNRFADEAGWEGYCPSCLACRDDHAEGEHDPPVDVCLLCR